MARPLRIELAGGWHHVTNRGHRAGVLFHNDTDRRRFFGLVSELPERFRVEVHAFVLMDNHYHLLLRTLEPNLGHAVRWLNVSYGVKFNWAHGFHGAVFQGRFKSVVIEDESGVTEVARYIHLNPVRVAGLGLSKEDQRRAKVLGCDNPGKELVQRRIEMLREYQWSSWRVYSGAQAAPEWLETSVVGTGCGGRSRAEQRQALRAYTEEPIRQGVLESPWSKLAAGLVLGDVEFARRLLSGRKVVPEEQTQARKLSPKMSWAEVKRASEAVQGSQWNEWAERRGDWGRDGTIYVAVRYGGLRLAEVVEQISGLRYQAAAQAMKRFGESLAKDRNRQRFVAELRKRMSNI